MAIESYFFNAIKNGDTYDCTYNAQDITNYLNLLVGNGVFPNPSTQLQVVANAGMKIAVKNGSGWIDGHKIVNTSDLLLPLDVSDVVLNRIDSIVFYVDHAHRNMGIKVKKGTPASTPVTPQVVRDTNIYEMQLATVSISKQVTAITQSMITDTRGMSSVCGWVQGLIQQASTETLFMQWNAAYDDSIKEDTSKFNVWFDDVVEKLKTAIPTKQYTCNYESEEENQSILIIPIEQYVMNLDILNLYINGFRLIRNKDFIVNSNERITLIKPLSRIGTQVEIEIYKSVSDITNEV